MHATTTAALLSLSKSTNNASYFSRRSSSGNSLRPQEACASIHISCEVLRKAAKSASSGVNTRARISDVICHRRGTTIGTLLGAQ